MIGAYFFFTLLVFAVGVMVGEFHAKGGDSK